MTFRLTMVAVLLLTSVFPAPEALAASTSRPFWTEKSSFVEGDDLFVVAIGSHARTLEEGRQKAFAQGKIELMNFAQVTDLEAQGLVIETEMTYEEADSDGTVSVFRLLRVPVTKLSAIQERLQIKSRTQEQAFGKTRQELIALQQSLSQKQQELETRTHSVQATLSEMTQLQSSLSERAQKIDQQQRQVEQLLKQLHMKSQTGASTLERLQQADAQLEEKDKQLESLYRKVSDRVQSQSQKACKYVQPGMQPRDVKSLLGEPDGRNNGASMDPDRPLGGTWSYGGTGIHFSYTGIVDRLAGGSRR